MDSNRKSKAIVLNRQDYREYDSLVSFYTLNFGKLTLIARGTKKIKSKLAGHIEPIALVDLMVISGKGRDYAASVISQESFSNILDDLNKLHYAGLGIRWLLRLTEENEADPPLFLLLVDYLEVLDSYPEEELSKEMGELIFSFFIFKFLSLIGYTPEVYNCLSCRKEIGPGNNYFNLNNGGLICESCFSKREEGTENEILKISDNCIKLLRFMLKNEIVSSRRLKIDKKLVKEIRVLTKGFLDFRS